MTKKKGKKKHANNPKSKNDLNKRTNSRSRLKVVRAPSAEERCVDEPDSARRAEKSSQQTIVFCKKELARQFYWCDEHDFYMMRPPPQEVLSFCNHVYAEEDILDDVLHFLPRVEAAQRAGWRYLVYRVTMNNNKWVED